MVLKKSNPKNFKKNKRRMMARRGRDRLICRDDEDDGAVGTG